MATHGRLPAALALAAAFLATTCKDASPVGPRGPTLTQSLRIEGATSVAPGGTAPLRAILESSRGTQEDVTSRAQWQVQHDTLATVTTAGVLRGVERGETDVIATYSGAVARRHVFVLEPGTFRLNGRVHDGGVPIPNSRVAVTRGTGAGLATTSNASGLYYLYGVAGEIDVAISHEQYRPATHSLNIGGHTQVDLTATPLVEPIQMAGSWILTIGPSSSCTNLPADVWPRRYPADIAQTGREIRMSVSANLCGNVCTVVFTGTISGQSVTIDFKDDVFYGPWLTELLPSGAYASAYGSATGQWNTGRIDGQLSGGISYWARPNRPVLCENTAHPFRLEPVH